LADGEVRVASAEGEVFDAHDKVGELERQLRETEQEVQALRAAKASAESSSGERSDAIASVEADAAEARRDADALREQLAAAKAENEMLRQASADAAAEQDSVVAARPSVASSAPPPPAGLEASTARIADLEAQTRRLEDALADAAVKAGRTLSAERKARAAAEKELTDRYESRFSELSRRLHDLESDLSRAKSRAASAEEALREQTAQLAAAEEAQAEAASREERDVELVAGLAAIERDVAAAQQQADAAEASLEKQTRKAAEAEEAANAAALRASVAESRLVAVEGELRETRRRADEADDALQRQQRRAQAAEEMLDEERSTWRRRVEEATDALSTARHEHARELERALTEHTKALSKAADESSLRVSRLEDALAAAATRHADAMAAVGEERAKAEVEGRARYEARFVALSDQLERLEADLERTRRRATSAEAELSQARARAEAAEQRGDDADRKATTARQQALQTEGALAAASARSISEMREEHSAALDRLRAEAARAEEVAADQRARDVKDAEARAAERVTALQAEHARAVAALETQLERARQQVADADTELEQERRAHEQSVSAAREAEVRAAELRDRRVAAVRAEKEALADVVTNLQGRLDASDKECARLRKALETVRARASADSQHVKDAHRTEMQRRMSKVLAAADRSVTDALAGKKRNAGGGASGRLPPSKLSPRIAADALPQQLAELEAHIPVFAAATGDDELVDNVRRQLAASRHAAAQLVRTAAAQKEKLKEADRDCDSAVDRANAWRDAAMREKARADAADAAAKEIAAQLKSEAARASSTEAELREARGRLESTVDAAEAAAVGAESIASQVINEHVRRSVERLVHGVRRSALATRSVAFHRWRRAVAAAASSASGAGAFRPSGGDALPSHQPASLSAPPPLGGVTTAPVLRADRGAAVAFCARLCEAAARRRAMARWHAATVAARADDSVADAWERESRANEAAALARVEADGARLQLEDDRRTLSRAIASRQRHAGLLQLQGLVQRRLACRQQAAFVTWSMAAKAAQQVQHVLTIAQSALGAGGGSLAGSAAGDSDDGRPASLPAARDHDGLAIDSDPAASSSQLDEALSTMRRQHEREMARLEHEAARRAVGDSAAPPPSSPIVPRSSRRQVLAILRTLVSQAAAVASMQQQLADAAAHRGEHLSSDIEQLEAMEARALESRTASSSAHRQGHRHESSSSGGAGGAGGRAVTGTPRFGSGRGFISSRDDGGF